MLSTRTAVAAAVMLLLACAATTTLALGMPRPSRLQVPRGLHRSLAASVSGRRPSGGVTTPTPCKVIWFEQDIDHFTFSADTYMERVFVCDAYWKGGDAPIFFYTGNEANVELYVNQTGLMWENAASFGALLVFAEARYFGESLPFPAGELLDHMEFLSVEQILADYATLVYALRNTLVPGASPDTPVIAFGGSFGGMLSSWFRMKYPSACDGAIAASAPIWAFEGEIPPVNPDGFYAIVTNDTTATCRANVRSAWEVIDDMAATAAGRAELTKLFRFCDEITSGPALAEWIQGAWAYTAMGDYPYESSYITNGEGLMPPWPMKVACSSLDTPNPDNATLLTGLREAVAVFYNATKDKECFTFASVNNQTDDDALFWGYLYCTEMIQEFGQNGVTDMFWPAPWDLNATIAGCKEQWNVTTRPLWATIEFGGKDLSSASNIVFSHGSLDPWTYGCVSKNSSASVTAVEVIDGGHHLDLFFSNPADPQSVVDVRAYEVAQIRSWVDEAVQRRRRS